MNREQKTIDKDLYPCEAKNCPYCKAAEGVCALQDYDFCMNVATWTDLYKNCPLNKKHR